MPDSVTGEDIVRTLWRHKEAYRNMRSAVNHSG